MKFFVQQAGGILEGAVVQTVWLERLPFLRQLNTVVRSVSSQTWFVRLAVLGGIKCSLFIGFRCVQIFVFMGVYDIH